MATLATSSLTASAVYNGSDGSETRRLLGALRRRGLMGDIAASLFTAQKASERAKRYGHAGFQGSRGRVTYRDLSYTRKGEALFALCEILKETDLRFGEDRPFLWGWRKDGSSFASVAPPWVLYVDLPTGQVSFHSLERYAGPEYPREWDGVRKASAGRIVAFCQNILDGNFTAL